MCEEFNNKTVNICVIGYKIPNKNPIYVAHCLELDLIGEGISTNEAISKLKKLIEIQYHLYKTKNIEFYAYPDNQWILCHKAKSIGKPEEKKLKIKNICGTDNLILHTITDKKHSLIRNKESWKEECHLQKLIKLLQYRKVSWHLSQERDYGYFLGSFPTGTDGILQSYPLYISNEMMIKWYHLKNIAIRFGLDNLNSQLN